MTGNASSLPLGGSTQRGLFASSGEESPTTITAESRPDADKFGLALAAAGEITGDPPDGEPAAGGLVVEGRPAFDPPRLEPAAHGRTEATTVRVPPQVTWQQQLGVAIRSARATTGLSQAEVARALEVRQSSVSQWEAARTIPSTRHMLGLFRLFGEELFRRLLAAAEEAFPP